MTQNILTQDNKGFKIALVLGAGGARGFCHIGVIRALLENGIYPDIVTGSSMGSIIGASYCYGMPIDKIEEMAIKVRNRHFSDLNLAFFTNIGLLQSKKMSAILKRLFGDTRIEDLKIPYAAASVDFMSGELVIMDKGLLWEAARASSAIPLIFMPYEKDGMVLYDGGLLCRMPIQTAKDMGADVVIAVDALGPIRRNERPDNLIKVMLRAYHILDWKNTCCSLDDAQVCIVPDMGAKDEMQFKDNDIPIMAGYVETNIRMPEIKKAIEKVKALKEQGAASVQ